MVKKKFLRKHVRTNSTHILIRKSIVAYAVLVFILFTSITLAANSLVHYTVYKINTTRQNTVTNIYDGFKLGDDYKVVRSNIFGDKRLYSWDKSRSYSSSVEYTHNDTATKTFAELKQKIEASGFNHFETDYKGTVAQQYHFKNKKNQYVRVNVVASAWQNAMLYGTPQPAPGQDVDTAPVYVTIRVNLDNNND